MKESATGETLIRFFIDRYNSRNLSEMLDLCSESIVLEDKILGNVRQGYEELKHQLLLHWGASEEYVLSFSKLDPIQRQGEKIKVKLELLVLDKHKTFIDPDRGPVFAVKFVNTVPCELVAKEIDGHWKVVKICWSFFCHRRSVNVNFFLDEASKMA